MAATAAKHRRRIAAPIEQHQHLLATLEPLLDGLGQGGRDELVAPVLLKLGTHVHDVDLRQGTVQNAGGQLPVLPALLFYRSMIGLQLGRGAAQHHHRSFELSPLQGAVAPLIARRFLLFIGTVMLLVDDDHPQVAQRREYCRPSSHRHLTVPIADLFPLVEPLALGESAVQDGHPVTKPGTESTCDLGSEANLGHHHQGPALLLQHRFDNVEIDLGLARTGDSMQQQGGKGALLEKLLDPLDDVGLIGSQWVAPGGDHFLAPGRAVNRDRFN